MVKKTSTIRIDLFDYLDAPHLGYQNQIFQLLENMLKEYDEINFTLTIQGKDYITMTFRGKDDLLEYVKKIVRSCISAEDFEIIEAINICGYDIPCIINAILEKRKKQKKIESTFNEPNPSPSNTPKGKAPSRG